MRRTLVTLLAIVAVVLGALEARGGDERPHAPAPTPAPTSATGAPLDILPLGQVLRAFQGRAVSDDGRLLAGYDGLTLALHDLRSGALTDVAVPAPEDASGVSITGVWTPGRVGLDFGPGGGLLAIGRDDGALAWDVRGRRLLWRFLVRDHARLARDGARLASLLVGAGGRVVVLSSEERRAPAKGAAADPGAVPVVRVLDAATGRLLASADGFAAIGTDAAERTIVLEEAKSRALRFLDVASGKVVDLGGAARDAALDRVPLTSRVSPGVEGRRIHETRTGAPAAHLPADGFAFPSRDGRRVAWTPDVGISRVSVLDAVTGAVVSRFRPEGGARHLALSPDGALVLLLRPDERTDVYDATSGALRVTIGGASVPPFAWGRVAGGRAGLTLGSSQGLLSLDLAAGRAHRFSDLRPAASAEIVEGPGRGGALVALQDSAREEVVVLDVASGAVVGRYAGEVPAAPGGEVAPRRAVALSPDGARVAYADERGALVVRRLEGGAVVRRVDALPGPLDLVAFDAAGAHVTAVAGGSLLRLSVEAGGPEAAPVTVGAVVSIAPTGRRALTADATSIRIVDMEAGRVVWEGPRAAKAKIARARWDGAGTAVAVRHEGAPAADVLRLGARVERASLGRKGSSVVDALPLGAGAVLLCDGARAWVADAGTGAVTRELPGEARLLAASDDGRAAALAAVRERPGWRVVSLESGAEVARVAGDPRRHDLRFVEEGRALLLLDGAQGSASVVDLPSGRERFRVYHGGASSFLCRAGDAYWASPDALPAFGVRGAEGVLPLASVDLTLHRPDAVLERVGAPGAVVALHRAAREARIRRLGLDPARIAASRPPSVEVDLSSAPSSTTLTSIRLSVLVRAGAAPVERLRVSVNRVPLLGARGRPLALAPGLEERATVDVALTSGRNEVEVAARAADGTESVRASVVVNAALAPARPRLRVLAVGVSAYADAAISLAYAAKDARDVARLFEETGRARFASVESLVITDAEAVRERVLAARAFLEGTGPGDAVVAFFAGHGLLDARGGYIFATHDVDVADPARRGLSFEEVDGLLDGIPAREKLLLVDTCHAGEAEEATEGALSPVTATAGAGGDPAGVVRARGFGKAFAPSRAARPAGGAALARELFADLELGSGALVVASSGGREFALESADWKNGLFTYALVSGVRDGVADGDRDRVLRFSELRDHAAEVVRRFSGGQQRPNVRRGLLGRDPVLFDRRPGGRDPEPSRDTCSGTLAISPDGALTATGGPDGIVVLVRSAAGSLARRLRVSDGGEGGARAFDRRIVDLSFHPTAPLLLASTYKGGHAVFDVESGEQLLSLPGGEAARARFTPDGRRVAVVHDGRATLHPLDDVPPASIEAPSATAVVAAGGRLWTLDRRGDDGLHALRPFTSAGTPDGPPLSVRLRTAFVQSTSASRDGRRIAISTGTDVVVVDVESRATILRRRAGGVPVALDPGGRLLAVAGTAIGIFDLETGRPIRRVDPGLGLLTGWAPGDSTVNGLAFDPSGGILACVADTDGSGDTIGRLWVEPAEGPAALPAWPSEPGLAAVIRARAGR